jgi:hypothetical protein
MSGLFSVFYGSSVPVLKLASLRILSGTTTETRMTHAFDDFAWWDTVDAKIKAVYPEGVFTEKVLKSFNGFITSLLPKKSASTMKRTQRSGKRSFKV